MNWLKKGPQLRMPQLKRPSLKGSGGKGPAIKPPAFLADLYYDLRDRRLLLPIALVIVAIAAVPFLLGDSEPVEPPPAVSAAPETGPPASASLAVVEAKPGLRDYRKRLDSRTATNPFKQRYTSLPDSAQVESTSVSSSVSGGGGAGGATVPGVEGEVTEPAPAPPASGGGGDGEGAARPYELVIDVQISRTEKTADGKEKTGELEVRHNVPVLTQLPGKKTPVVTTMGANFSKERLLFLVSHEVKAIRGDFACITRGKICELLEVELGMLLEYVYEPSGASYAIKVTGVDAIPARKGRGLRSSRAALGRPRPGMAFDTP
jgi:DNA-binding Xre family transcriptional regulator